MRKPVRSKSEILARNLDGNKQCISCGNWKSEDSFHSLATSPDNLSPWCKDCAVESAKQSRWLRKYNLTPEEYDNLLAKQGNACAICRTKDPGRRSWHVDHWHKCCPGPASCGDCVRGLLCGRCNVMLGYAREDVETLQNAVAYLTTQFK